MKLTPDGKHLANTWQGNFPNENLAADGFHGVSTERVRKTRHDRQRLGVDRRLVVDE
jgi:formylglycine-generating enzyme